MVGAYTLPKTNSSHPKMEVSNRNLRDSRGRTVQVRTVSFRECSLLEKAISLVKIYNQTFLGDDFFPTMEIFKEATNLAIYLRTQIPSPSTQVHQWCGRWSLEVSEWVMGENHSCWNFSHNSSRRWFQIFFIFIPIWGKIPILTNILQMGLKPPTSHVFLWTNYPKNERKQGTNIGWEPFSTEPWLFRRKLNGTPKKYGCFSFKCMFYLETFFRFQPLGVWGEFL